MSRFTDTFRNIFKIHELRQRIIYTLILLVIVRIGAHITIPGVDSALLAESTRNQTSDNLFGLYDLFVGGAFSNAAIFALGIMPYISASIIIQIMGAVVPYFQKLQQEGEEGRKKITQLTRYGTVLISALQAWGVTVRLLNIQVQGMPIIPEPIQGMAWTISTIIILTAGTVFMMWLGEQITERGIGNGISLIIFIGIVARFPTDLVNSVRALQVGPLSPRVAAAPRASFPSSSPSPWSCCRARWRSTSTATGGSRSSRTGSWRGAFSTWSSTRSPSSSSR